MVLSVRTNSPAINSNRILNKTSGDIHKSLEKLSSGFRINRAADDASGLAISEKMREQITSLDKFIANVEDGISLIQTADGYMNEIQDMLLRNVELSLKASNGIYEDKEREMIQGEIDQLNNEIDRITDTANFNGLLLFRGVYKNYTEKEYQEWDERIPQPPIIESNLPSWTSIDSSSTSSGSLGSIYVDSQGVSHSASYLDMSGFENNGRTIAENITAAIGKGFYTTCCTCDRHYSVRFNDSNTSNLEISGRHFIYNVGIAGASSANDIYSRIINATNNGHPENHYTNIAVSNGKLVIYDNRSYPDVKPNVSSGEGLMGAGIATDQPDLIQHMSGMVDVQKTKMLDPIIINAGNEYAGKFIIYTHSMSTQSLKINDADVMTTDTALDSMGKFKNAMEFISIVRADIGAMQNRMEHTIADLSNALENISAAKSKIKDTDMAKEMMKYTSFNVMGQASQAMLAQANVRAQNVLQLL